MTETAKLAIAVGASPWESRVFLDGREVERLTAIHFVAEPMTAVHVHLTYLGYPGVRGEVVDPLTIQHAAADRLRERAKEESHG